MPIVIMIRFVLKKNMFWIKQLFAYFLDSFMYAKRYMVIGYAFHVR